MGTLSSLCQDKDNKLSGFDSSQMDHITTSNNSTLIPTPSRSRTVQKIYIASTRQKPLDFSIQPQKLAFQPIAISILDQSGVYIGETNSRGSPNGPGQIYFSSGNFLQAVFSDGHIDSEDALYIQNCGDSYRGGFKGSSKTGLGVMRASSQCYRGRFSKGRLEGKGQLQFVDGRIYTGNFKNGKMEGKGSLTQKNGDVYEGYFKGGKKNGIGSFKTDRYEYYGPFYNDVKDGKGTLIFKGGGKYQGWLEKDMISGYGQWHKPNGTVQKKVYREQKISDFFK